MEQGTAEPARGRYKGPCTIECPEKCDVPEGVTIAMVPRPRHAWGDVVNCPNGDCERSFLVIDHPEGAPGE